MVRFKNNYISIYDNKDYKFLLQSIELNQKNKKDSC